MAAVGTFGLLVAFFSCIASVVLAISSFAYDKKGAIERSEKLAKITRSFALLSALALSICCIVLVYCFLSGDNSIDYVVRNRSHASGALGVLYKISGLWAGRSGSLMFWAWLISIFSAVLIIVIRKRSRQLDNVALGIAQIVILLFLAVILFTPSNMPFALLPDFYFDESGALNAAAYEMGMNPLLEHWAMAIHPPTLFIGYAGMTFPFAYAISALVVNDSSDSWVKTSKPYLMVSWFFLTAGIGLGAIWAYVVLGWGGYWGWDPVENASLLPWLIGVALIHSFTVYSKRGQFKLWSVMCACLAFFFVILGTFITRSGIVQSVHAFEGNTASILLFVILMVLSLVGGAVGVFVRRKDFASEGASEDQEIDSLMSRDAAYYMNNLLMVVSAVVLAYMTISSALPAWMPFGGQALSANTYNAIARPLVIVYCAIVAVCPLLAWRRTQVKVFAKNAIIPGIFALVLFALLMFYFFTYLLPSYNAMIDAGGSLADGLLEQGPPAYYNALAVVGFFVASFLIFNALSMLFKSLRAGVHGIRSRLSVLGGSICHAMMGVILIGLIGSSMYVTEVTGYMDYDPTTDSCTSPFVIKDYELTYDGSYATNTESGIDQVNLLMFDVTKNGEYVGVAYPAIQQVETTQQQKLIANVISLPLEDLFVVYRGINDDGDLAIDVRVNPLISFVWIGFGLFMVGALISIFSKRSNKESVRSDKLAKGSENGPSEDMRVEGLKDNKAHAKDS